MTDRPQFIRVVDHAGNPIKVGRLLRWQPSPASGPLDLYVKVKDVVAPDDKMPGKVVLELSFGIAPNPKKDAVCQFRDFVTVLDPEDELRAEAVVEKVADDNVRTMSAR